MNELLLTNTILPIVSNGDYLAAAEPFYHADRIADFHVMIYVTDGCIYVTEDEVDYALTPGTLFFLKSGIRHFGKTETQRGTRWYYVHFYMDNTSDTLARKPLSVTMHNNTLSERSPVALQLMLPKLLTGLSDSKLEVQIISFVECFHSNNSQHKWNINHLFFQLLTEIANYDKSTDIPLSLADRISQYLEAHFEQSFSAATLEQHFFLSYKYMAAVFKKEKQLTMQQYHTQVRMNQACKLLRSTLLPIGEISLQLGYTDMLYFSRCFHTYIGMSPSEYRKQPHSY